MLCVVAVIDNYFHLFLLFLLLSFAMTTEETMYIENPAIAMINP